LLRAPRRSQGPHPSPADVLDWLGAEPADRADCEHLLAGETHPSVVGILEELERRLDADIDVEPSGGSVRDELAWIEAYLRFAPEVLRWHAARGVPEEISRDTLADFGRNLAINRRVHGRFGMDTWPWLAHHFAGRLFQLGRLQYLIHRTDEPVPGLRAGEWILGIHIPESGSLAQGALEESLAMARPFFARCFPDRPVRLANCASWLLDPYLRGHMEPASNIVRFARLFTSYGLPTDAPTDAVYFTFRTRRMDGLKELPRKTSLQRTVLERIDDGGTWQLGHGYLPLP
jgi:hypothetical protein